MGEASGKEISEAICRTEVFLMFMVQTSTVKPAWQAWYSMDTDRYRRQEG